MLMFVAQLFKITNSQQINTLQNKEYQKHRFSISDKGCINAMNMRKATRWVQGWKGAQFRFDHKIILN